MEEVPDVEHGGLPRKPWIEDYPGDAGRAEGAAETSFELHDKARKAAGDALWAPFEDEQEWQLAHWLVTSGLTQTNIEKFLKLDIVSTWAQRTGQDVQLTEANVADAHAHEALLREQLSIQQEN